MRRRRKNRKKKKKKKEEEKKKQKKNNRKINHKLTKLNVSCGTEVVRLSRVSSVVF